MSLIGFLVVAVAFACGVAVGKRCVTVYPEKTDDELKLKFVPNVSSMSDAQRNVMYRHVGVQGPVTYKRFWATSRVHALSEREWGAYP